MPTAAPAKNVPRPEANAAGAIENAAGNRGNRRFGSSDEILMKLIKGDIPDQKMPRVFGALPEDEIWKILAYIRSQYAGDPSKVDW